MPLPGPQVISSTTPPGSLSTVADGVLAQAMSGRLVPCLWASRAQSQGRKEIKAGQFADHPGSRKRQLINLELQMTKCPTIGNEKVMAAEMGMLDETRISWIRA
jgi:hypothetical protein